jgi:hypothetical protein|tara:strand:- start:3099 stop:3392 length:294 start_codon:yes stop_codon:yes gene_type:complete
MSLQQTWTRIKQQHPATPSDFMRLVLEYKHDITEHEIIAWQRASHDWTTGIFDFLWFAFQVHQGHSEWLPHVQKMWPRVKSIINEHSLEDWMASMSL